MIHGFLCFYTTQLSPPSRSSCSSSFNSFPSEELEQRKLNTSSSYFFFQRLSTLFIFFLTWTRTGWIINFRCELRFLFFFFRLYIFNFRVCYFLRFLEIFRYIDYVYKKKKLIQWYEIDEIIITMSSIGCLHCNVSNEVIILTCFDFFINFFSKLCFYKCSNKESMY